MKLYEFIKIFKVFFLIYVWVDVLNLCQLIEYYGNFYFSCFEFVKIVLECLMSCYFCVMYLGDCVYVFMGFLCIWFFIDSIDIFFQVFVCLFLFQDSDCFMECLICFLFDFFGQNWEFMIDQYKVSLWDVYLNMQICVIGENDMVVIDDVKGVQIQWLEFMWV